MIIKLVRHGESEANVGHRSPQSHGDHRIELTARGRAMAAAAGKSLGAPFIRESLVYCSPYTRTRQTLEHLCLGAGLAGGRSEPGLRVFEDPRLREVEHGYAEVDAQQQHRAVHGWFYYRYEGGESPADCFDRTSSFLESLMRQSERKTARQALIVTHGLTIRCFVMRFLHLTVEEFESLANPGNCDVVTIAPAGDLADPLFARGRWAVEGLGLREGDG